jgi:hypothetical protein
MVFQVWTKIMTVLMVINSITAKLPHLDHGFCGRLLRSFLAIHGLKKFPLSSHICKISALNVLNDPSLENWAVVDKVSIQAVKGHPEYRDIRDVRDRASAIPAILDAALSAATERTESPIVAQGAAATANPSYAPLVV